jgi:hypothetical protein
MSTDKKPDDGKGVPAAAPAVVTEPKAADGRLVPGGSLASARRPIGVSAFDHYTEQPFAKADLPDLSETPGWNMVPKTDR